MCMNKVLMLIVALFFFSHENSQSQTLQNIHASFDGEKVHVYVWKVPKKTEQVKIIRYR